MKKFVVMIFFPVVAIAVGGALYWYDMHADSDVRADAVDVNSAAATVKPREIPPGFKEFKSGRFGFSILVPENTNVAESRETATSYTMVFTQPDGLAFQMYVVAHPGDQVSPERFAQDVPGGVQKDLENIMLGGVSGASFISHDPALGETREVWFIKNGYLFEVTSYTAFDEKLLEILSTWQFTR